MREEKEEIQDKGPSEMAARQLLPQLVEGRAVIE